MEQRGVTAFHMSIPMVEQGEDVAMDLCQLGERRDIVQLTIQIEERRAIRKPASNQRIRKVSIRWRMLLEFESTGSLSPSQTNATPIGVSCPEKRRWLT
jgi:hypothetical protein